MEPNTIDKHCNMKQFISAYKDYMKTKADDSTNLMIRHLQLLSVAIDLSTFNPQTNIVAEFFVSLHQLLSNVESGSLMAWCSVNVLCMACKNASARTALIHTYQFLPLLSRLLGNHLTKEKKLRLLGLMQELTCGIKISWQIPHLPHLMSTLTRWIESGDDDIATLSLGVLVNLCYKNLPAVYTLSRCVEIKAFLYTCSRLRGVKIEVHVCKLLIILDYMDGNIPESVILKLIEVTFKSLIEAFKAHDSILLRHIVEFFLDMWNQQNHEKVLMDFSNYDEEFEYILMELEKVTESGSGDIFVESEPECVSSVFEFIHFVMKLRTPKIEQLNSKLVNIALRWLQVELVSSDALAILRTLAIQIGEETCLALEPFLTNLPSFLTDVANGEGEAPNCTKNIVRLISLLELLRALMQTETTKQQVLAVVKEDFFTNIFFPLLGTTSPEIEESNTNAYSLEATLLYVNAIAFIHELMKYDEIWKIFFVDLMKHKQIHTILAQSLYCGEKQTKLLTMNLIKDDSFPTEVVAEAMCDVSVIQETSNMAKDSTHQMTESLCFPTASVTQIARLDDIIDKIKEAYQKNELVNVSTSDVMELYEYKLAVISQSEQAAIASVETASLRCTQLQHKIAQMTTELHRLHQLLIHTQQCQEDSARITNTTLAKYKLLQESLDKERAKFSDIRKEKEKTIEDQTCVIESANKRIKELENQTIVLERAHANTQKMLGKKIVHLEEQLEAKGVVLSKKEGVIQTLRMQISDLEKLVKERETELMCKSRQLTDVDAELQNCRSILGTITQLTSSHYACNDEK